MSTTLDIQKRNTKILVDKYVKPGSQIYLVYAKYLRIKVRPKLK